MSDDDLQVLFFQAKCRYKTALEAKKAADAALKNCCKQIKANLGDHGVTDIKTAIELESPEGEAALKERIEREMRVARWMGMAVGSEPGLFDEVDRTPAVDKKRAEGKRHGLAGGPCAPDCDASTPQYSSYLEGFHEGQAALTRQKLRPLSDTEELPSEGPDGPLSREEWRSHMRSQDEEVSADIKANGQIGTEPATAHPAAE